MHSDGVYELLLNAFLRNVEEVKHNKHDAYWTHCSYVCAALQWIYYKLKGELHTYYRKISNNNTLEKALPEFKYVVM